MDIKAERRELCKKLKTLIDEYPEEIWPINTALGYCMGQIIAEGASIQQLRELLEKVLMSMSP